MIKLLRKNNKKILAVIGVFLMIAFIVPTVSQQQFRDGSDQAVAYTGEEPILGYQLTHANQQWETLTRSLVIRNPMFGFEQSLPMLMIQQRLMQALPQEQMFFGMQDVLERSFRIVREIDAMHYLLLLREADRMNVVVPEEQVQGLFQELARQVPAVGRYPADYMENTLRNWLRVLAAFDRIASTVKISPALAFHELAGRDQEVALNLVQFRAEQFKAQVPAPSTEELQAFFQKYREAEPGTGELGFGYRYPNRVKFQSIRVPIERVKETITGVEMYEYFLANTDEFVDPPATQPAVEGAEAAATQPATPPATQPTPRPWERLTNEDKDRIQRTLAEQRAAMIAKAMQLRFSADWPTFRQAAREAGKPVPDQVPNSTLNVPYSSYSYLLRLQQQVQNSRDARGVLPELWEEGTLRSARELEQLPGIGRAAVVDRRVPFPVYATQLVEAFLTEQQQQRFREEQLPPLALYQPSPIFQDPDGNLYIFRLTAVEAAHPAPSLDGVADRVRQDYVTWQAYERAQAAAKQFLDQARQAGIAQAAQAATGLEVVRTDLFANTPGARVQNVQVPDAAMGRFVEQSFDLLRERLRTGNPSPVGLIDLPQTQTVMVAQLAEAKPAERDQGFDVQVSLIQHQMRTMRAASMMPNWFAPEAIEERMQFREAERPARQLPEEPGRGRPPIIPGH